MGIYHVTKDFPKSERYGVTSQLRRAAVSVMLNYVEGFARMRTKVTKNFYEISYGSLKETLYLIYLSKELGYITSEEYNGMFELNDRIGGMLYKTIEGLKH